MKARGYWGSFCIIALVSGVPSILLLPAVMSLLISGGFEAYGILFPAGLIGGSLFGVMFGLVFAMLIMKVQAVVPVRNENDFFERLKLAIAEIGYAQPSGYEPRMTFHSTPMAGRFAGDITVVLGDDSARIAGPRMPVRKLAAKLARDS